jgi:small subunit ribosomal protein S7
MSRRRTAKKRLLTPDPIYDSRLLHMVVNRIMKSGKKSLAYKICYDAMTEISEMTKQDPILILEQAIRNATPVVELKARRVGGATYQVPIEVQPERGSTLAIQWILNSARSRSGRDMVSKLKSELLDAAKNIGGAIKKRDEVHKMAEANKAFAKYRF